MLMGWSNECRMGCNIQTCIKLGVWRRSLQTVAKIKALEFFFVCFKPTVGSLLEIWLWNKNVRKELEIKIHKFLLIWSWWKKQVEGHPWGFNTVLFLFQNILLTYMLFSSASRDFLLRGRLLVLYFCFLFKSVFWETCNWTISVPGICNCFCGENVFSALYSLYTWFLRNQAVEIFIQVQC